MKTKNRILIWAFLLLAFFPNQDTYAEETSELSEKKPATDLKTGDELIILESEPEETEVKIEQPLKKINSSLPKEIKTKEVEKKPEIKVEEKVPTEKKQEPQPEPRASETTKELNPYKEKTQAPKVDSSTNNKVETPKKENQTVKDEDIDQLLKDIENSTNEIKSQLDEIDQRKTSTEKTTSKVSQPSSESRVYQRSINNVTELVSSNKLSKKDSQKLMNETKAILDEYNVKIKNAESDRQRKILAKEAAEKIDNSIKNTSIASYNQINKSEDLDIDDQKNDTLKLEITGPALDKDPMEDKNDSKSKSRKESITLPNSPRSSQYEEEYTPYLPVLIVLVIIIVMVISLSLVVALKSKDKARK